MKAKDVVLFVYDELTHFEKNLEYLGESTFKKIIRIDSLDNLNKELSSINDDEFIFLIVHVFYTEKIKGLKKYTASGIGEEYPLIGGIYVSDGVEKSIQKDMVDEFGSSSIKDIKKYYEVRSSIEKNLVEVFTKNEVVNNLKNDEVVSTGIGNVDYVIITALEQDEMEKVLPLIEKIKTIENSKHLIELGYFKSKPDKKVIYASQINSGMVDAAILGTELICTYKPKFLIMTGVMGGKPKDTIIGDIIVSKKVFTIDKGKLTEEEFKREIESVSTESSTTIRIERDKMKIIDFVKKKDEIYNRSFNIHCEPVACVRSVIDRKGFFKDDVLSVDRKTIGLEMEGYGIARACQIVNEGRTVPLIIKSVMDNTEVKTDEAKKLAAWTSAKVLEYIILHDII